MGFPLTPATPFVDGLSRIPAAVANAWRIAISRSLDTVNGGDYGNGTLIRWITGSAGWEFDADVTIGAAAQLLVNGIASLSKTRIAQDPVDLSDADHTLDSSTGSNYIRMLTAPAASRVLTLRQSTSPLPVKGDWFEITVLIDNSANVVSLQREGSSDYVAILGAGAVTSGNNVASAKVRFDGTNWRLLSVGGKFAFHGGDA